MKSDLTPITPFKPTTNSLFRYEKGGRVYLVKHYVGKSALQRCEQEKKQLLEWEKNGFSVPCLHDIAIEEVPAPYLVMDFVDGISLRQFLADEAVSLDDKMQQLKVLFVGNELRHRKALSSQNPLLVHFDANSGNILLTEKELVFIDFESPVVCKNLPGQIGREIAKLCRWACRDVGRAGIAPIISLLVDIYREHVPLLIQLAQRTTNVPFQFYHRLKDRNKKAKYPEEVTKYDIADTLLRELSRRGWHKE